MSKKVVVKISDDEFLLSKSKELGSIRDSVASQLVFLEKQVTDLRDKARAESLKVWESVEKYIVPKYLESYNKDTHNLEMDDESDALYISDHDHKEKIDISSLLKALMPKQ